MNISFLENADSKFLSQTADPDLRKEEIARLKRSRRSASFGAAAMFLLFVVRETMFPASRLMDDKSTFLFVMVVCMMLQFYEVQHRLRLVLLAEQLSARPVPSGS